MSKESSRLYAAGSGGFQTSLQPGHLVRAEGGLVGTKVTSADLAGYTTGSIETVQTELWGSEVMSSAKARQP